MHSDQLSRRVSLKLSIYLFLNYCIYEIHSSENHSGLIADGISIAAIYLRTFINRTSKLVLITLENNEIKTHQKKTFFDRIRPFVLFCRKKLVFHLFALQ